MKLSLVTTVAAQLFGFAMTLFVGTIVYQTVLLDDSDKIVMHPGTIMGWPSADKTLHILYTRGFTVNSAGEGDLLQKVVCTCPKGEIEEWDRPVLHRMFEKGDYPGVARYIETPLKEPVGSKCELHTFGVWRPPFAISSQMKLLDTLKFTVQEVGP